MYEDRQWGLFTSCLLGLRVTPLVGPTPFIWAMFSGLNVICAPSGSRIKVSLYHIHFAAMLVKLAMLFTTVSLFIIVPMILEHLTQYNFRIEY
jgi:hypothetical protein